MTRVVIVQETLPHYRVPLFERLREALSEAEVQLDLVVGQPSGDAARRRDQGVLAWATTVRNRRLGRLVWQPAWRYVRGADLVILEQANRHLLGYLLLIAARAGGTPVAQWGHGTDLQRDHSAWREKLKLFTTRRVSWFFAYTEGSAARVRAAGVDSRVITVVQNAVERPLDLAVNKVSGQCVFVGGLHAAKRLGVLLEAADHLATLVPEFHLHVIGDGAERGLIQQTPREHVTYHGMLTGTDRDAVLQRSELTLMPGLVGLVALDAFTARAPLVTIAARSHSPEIEYVIDGANGIVLPEDSTASEYALAVADLLLDPARLERLRTGCDVAASVYTLESMVERFAEGVLRRLDRINVLTPTASDAVI
jgi:glycosyltransferase involved in cell wall biosynthesis